MQAEIAHFSKHRSAAVFNDSYNLLDSIDIQKLILKAMETGFPLAELDVALQQHLAPRVLQVSGYGSSPTQVYKSILVGCKHSVAITKTLMLGLMTHFIAVRCHMSPRRAVIRRCCVLSHVTATCCHTSSWRDITRMSPVRTVTCHRGHRSVMSTRRAVTYHCSVKSNVTAACCHKSSWRDVTCHRRVLSYVNAA